MPPISRLLFAVLAAIALCHAGRIEKITEADRCSRLPDQYVRACLERICLGGQYVFEVERLMPNAAIIYPLPDSGIKDSARTGSSQCAVDSTSLVSITPYAASLLASKRESYQSARISALAFGASGVGVMILGEVYHMFASLSAASKQDTIRLFEKEPGSRKDSQHDHRSRRRTDGHWYGSRHPGSGPVRRLLYPRTTARQQRETNSDPAARFGQCQHRHDHKHRILKDHAFDLLDRCPSIFPTWCSGPKNRRWISGSSRS